MQDEVREATRYKVTLERTDGKPLDRLTTCIELTFCSDGYLTKEYLQNMRKALRTIKDSEFDRYLLKLREEVYEELHKKTD